MSDLVATASKLAGTPMPLVQMALKMARAYDSYEGADLTKLARLNQELRQTLQVIGEAARDDDSGADGQEMSTPVWHAEDPGTPDTGTEGGAGGAAAGQAGDAAPGGHI